MYFETEANKIETLIIVEALLQAFEFAISIVSDNTDSVDQQFYLNET